MSHESECSLSFAVCLSPTPFTYVPGIPLQLSPLGRSPKAHVLRLSLPVISHRWGVKVDVELFGIFPTAFHPLRHSCVVDIVVSML